MPRPSIATARHAAVVAAVSVGLAFTPAAAPAQHAPADVVDPTLGEEDEVEGWRYQQVFVGNPQCAIRVTSVAELEALDLPSIGPPIETDPRFPNRTNVSFWTELAPDRIRARIFERGVGETMSSGTGATGAAIAHVLRGGDSPVTVELDGGELVVDVGEDLHVDLTGWAVPVFTGEWPAPDPTS